MPRAADASRGRGQRGVALLLALLTMVLLSVVVLEFTVRAQVEARRAAMWSASRQAALVAESGVDLAAEVLALDARFGSTDSLHDIWAREIPPIDTGGGLLSVRIEDEQGRLNANALLIGAGSPPGRRFQSLFRVANLDPALVFPLADWVDRNREPGPSALAAEDSWYATLARPYKARNAPLRTWGELALVRGFTPPVLASLRRFVTVLPDVQIKVNVNTAPPEVLAALDPRLEDGFVVRALLDRRAASAFDTTASLLAVAGMQAFGADELDRLFTFSSRWFRVRATGEVRGAMRSVDALLYRDDAAVRVVHLLPRRGANIVGVDSPARARLDDAGLFGATRP